MARTVYPPELEQRAVELRALGNSWNTIAATLGVSHQTARRWASPGFAERARARSREAKQRRTGICVDCGGPTKYAGHKDGNAGASLRCTYCTRGVLPPRAPDARRRVPVRLCDLKPEALLAAAWEANRHEQNELERQEILLAAIAPSDDVHWVSESARAILDQVAA